MTTYATLPPTPTLAPTRQPPPQQDGPRYLVTDADRARQARIQAAWKAYHGELEKPLKPMPGQPDDNVMSNRCAPIVDGGVNFLFGKEIEISVEEGAPTEAQSLLDTTWGRKETRIPLLQDLAMNGAIAGRSFLRIVPSAPTTTTTTASGGKSSFRLVVIDPSIVCVETVPQDCETVLLYCLEYATQEMVNGRVQTVTYREEIARIDPDGNAARAQPDATDDTWRIQHWSRLGNDRGVWVASGEPILWPYPFPPLFSCKNLPHPNDFWGRPDITPDIIGSNNALNLVQSCINRVLKLYGQPIIYATGTQEGSIDIQPGRILTLPLTESKVVAVPIASDVANALAFAENLRSDVDEQSNVPGIATGRLTAQPRGDMSGVAIELLFMPILKKTEKKQCLYGEMILDVSQALLRLAGLGGDYALTIAWQNSLPHDDLPAAQAAVAKKQLMISNTTLQRELGYDPDEEAALNQSEDAQKLLNFSQGQGLPPVQAPPQPVVQLPENGGTA